MADFPKDFLWGAATSAYQVEGDNSNCDWWEWEKKAGLKETSGRACRHYEFYKEDFELASNLGHNAHRLSVEWSRIEPRDGEFSQEEIAHYSDVISSLRQRNLEPIVTLHHFTNPLWFAARGGWCNNQAPGYFLRYVEKITQALGNNVRYWVTINEPLVYVYHAYLLGVWPPQEASLLKARTVTYNLSAAHIKAYRLIHSIYEKRSLPPPLVSIAKNTQAFFTCNPTFRNRLAVYLRDRFYNFAFVDRLARFKTLDFIGINYYSPNIVNASGWGAGSIFTETCAKEHHPFKKNSLGWYIYPQGLYHLLLRFKRYKLPILILENGICTDDDALRWEYIRTHLKSVRQAMEEGVSVSGYLYWSLLDNFEWDKGFGPRFGLVEIDYRTYGRTIRESARKFSLVCKTGRLD